MTPPRIRLRRFRRHDLDARQAELYDTIRSGPRTQRPQAFRLVDDDGGLEGPFNAMLLSPAVGDALQSLGAALRYQGELSARLREIAILVVARHWDSAFERYAHEAIATAAGLQPRELDALRGGRFGELADPVERLAAGTAAALAERGDLDDAEFATAEAALGSGALFEITAIVGYYATLALQLRVYRVAAPVA